tara:strand:- start:388 stop:501 length:114 start_codon:yes stop_codon:yes gene_type:complete
MNEEELLFLQVKSRERVLIVLDGILKSFLMLEVYEIS